MNRRLPIFRPTRRDLLKAIGAGALSLSLAPYAGCAGRRAARRPNFVFILTDDHRHDALGCAGHPWIRTPHLDTLATEGVRFSNSFVTTSLCSPSRASFLSGQYAHAHGVCSNEQDDLPAAVPTFPRLLQAGGYRTAFIGKWHMARHARPRPGFDHWAAFSRQGDYRRNTLNVNGRWELSEKYVTDELTDRAEQFLAGPEQSPFLLYVSHKAIHAPFQPAPRHDELYRDVRIRPPGTPGERLDLKPDWRGRQPQLNYADHVRDYARTLAAVDESFGRIREILDRQGKLDNTVIIYAGDNGYLQGEHGGLWDKRTAYDPSIRIPLLIRYPEAFAPGEICEELALNLDVAPTILGLAGLTPPEVMPGLDLAAMARGKATRESFLYEYFAEQGMVPTTVALRTREYKYITYPENPEHTRELYHLRQDRGELENRIGQVEYSGVLADLESELASLKESTGFVMRRNMAP